MEGKIRWRIGRRVDGWKKRLGVVLSWVLGLDLGGSRLNPYVIAKWGTQRCPALEMYSRPSLGVLGKFVTRV
jgi:hypothetical protein